ncbi:hypothetical protein G7085_02090 [Tessaracoccus sp. HDW20]|uniref:hypothetical protein n=1 Tax=Tessaracoccus coleopterorum TaxID=2714950 RepID=UPI0018D49AA8|nr:hypothetical protein [Tessaracoccus coleopterorum]NHB83871.1 hypothetical protein [Tessaracoccus coleopterorum]
MEGPANQLAVLPTAVDLLGFDLISDLAYRPSLASGEEQGRSLRHAGPAAAARPRSTAT